MVIDARYLVAMDMGELTFDCDTGPTIDSIEMAEFESQAALREWLSKNAPAFLPAEK